MFTECPQCKTAFRLTAKVLRQAQGRVRCGGCGSTFNAIDHLSEETPDDQPSQTQTARAFDNQSRALLDSLDELAGRENVRIEDTGVEWRVLDVDGASNADDRDAVAAEEQPDPDASGVDPSDDHTATGTINWTFEDVDESETATAADASEESAGDADDTISASLDAEPDAGDNAAADVPVLDSEEAGSQAAFDLPTEELRFDDHTPLPDEYYKPSENPEFRDNEDAAAALEAAPGLAQRASGDAAPAEIDMTDEGDWEDLLAEVDLDDSPALAPEDRAAAPGDEPARAAASSELHADDAPQDEPLPATADTEPEPQNDAEPVELVLEDAPTGEEAVAEEQQPEESEVLPESGASAETEVSGANGSEQPAEFGTSGTDAGDEDELARSVEMEIDQELMRAAAETGALTVAIAADEQRADAENEGTEAAAAPDEADEEVDPALVESIVMEGDTVTDLLLEAEHATLDGDSLETADDTPAGSERPALRYGMIAAAAVLAIALAAQLVHANRESLATQEGFASSLTSLYDFAGSPVTPKWDVSGWQFESTNGSTDEADQRLTIFSRISNRSEDPLPYPLVHLALTDRFEDVVGSRILTPAEYLAGNGSPDRPVAPGAGFTAVIAVDAPSPDATGFKLNVCYRLSGEQLRCAVEDFRD